MLAPTNQLNTNIHSIRSQRHSPERTAINFLQLAIVASTRRTTASGVSPLVPLEAKNTYKEHAWRLLAHLSHVSFHSISPHSNFCRKAVGPMDPCNKFYPKVQRQQQGRLSALEDEVLCDHAFSEEGNGSQIHSFPLKGHLLPCSTFHKRNILFYRSP